VKNLIATVSAVPASTQLWVLGHSIAAVAWFLTVRNLAASSVQAGCLGMGDLIVGGEMYLLWALGLTAAAIGLAYTVFRRGLPSRGSRSRAWGAVVTLWVLAWGVPFILTPRLPQC
jgi:hypothetical protein